jgi:uncharacterized protein (TIGR02680 family)
MCSAATISEVGTVRWRPARAGIRNIWEYDDQVFHFADGRLVLRGPNGSGKSNALALLVPFLLDGVMAAHRMDSMSGGRSMRTLLLSLADDDRGKRFRHEQRTGYIWLEFEKAEQHLCIGCGARASAQRDAEAWFFVTPARPGFDLELAPGGVPLSKSALSEAIGPSAIHDSAESYRAAVDRCLFGLGAHRYHNLVELLLVMRRPHLAGKLNLEQLSRVLSDGLAALDDQLIVDVAASFDDLEAVQNDLRKLVEAHRTVQAFLPVYSRYLRSAAHSRAVVAAEAVRSLRAAHRRVTDTERTVAETTAEAERLRVARSGCEEAREVTEQRRRAVLESPAYRDAKSLVEIEERVAHDQDQLGLAERRLEAAQTARQGAVEDLEQAQSALRQASSETSRAFDEAGAAADVAGVVFSVSREEIASPGLGPMLRGFSARRHQDISAVRTVLSEADRASSRASAARDAAVLARQDADLADAARQEAGEALDLARANLADDLRQWAVAQAVVQLVEPHGLAELALSVGEPGAPTLRDALVKVLRPRREALAAQAALLELDLRSVSEAQGAATAERARVAEKLVPAPDPLPTRPADRSLRQGAPLYACCDFAQTVPPDERAGLEAALEAAGLLDAWVGEMTADLDAWARPGQAEDGPSLADVLVATPPEGSGLSQEIVGAVLGSISLTEAGIAVLPDGRFQLGPLHGRFAKEAPEFIGATAREQRRQRLLGEIDLRLAELAAQLEGVSSLIAGVVTQQQMLDEVTASLPSPDVVVAARDALLTAVATAREAGRAANRTEAVAQEARRAADGEMAQLRALSTERRLPATADGLEQAAALLQAFEHSATELVQRSLGMVENQRGVDRAVARSTHTEVELQARSRERDALHRDVRALRARVDQLRSQLGADAQAPLRELAIIQDEITRLRTAADQLDVETEAAAERRGRAKQDHEAALSAIASCEASAAEASARLDVVRREDVWSVVGEGAVPLPGAPDLAAIVLAATAEISAEADENALQRAFRQLLDELRRGYEPSLSYVDQVAIVEVTSEAGTFPVLWLARELGSHISRQQELLTQRDREIFERHLLTRVSESLRELLNDAHELVGRVNRALADRPTASGKTVQLRWEPETTDAELRAALALLRKSPELLGPDEREQLRRFFSRAIEQRRAEDAASGYAEVLRNVLDYRLWHVFTPYVRSAGGGSQRLTKALFQTLSGGEQAVVLHLPLFAAAAAHYDAATGEAPRLIALDEAFAGIDEGMRAELMGLLVGFDLDILLTGHELWGAYEQVPALMVYDLLRHPPLEGVSALAARWDGAVMAEA